MEKRSTQRAPLHRLPLAAALLVLGLSGCEPEQTEVSETPAAAVPQPAADDLQQATQALWQSGAEALATSANNFVALQQAVAALLANPGDDTLQLTRQAVISAQLAYRQFYFFSQLGVTEPNVFAPVARANFTLAAQPIQPGYLDYFGPYPYSGLVHDIAVEINAETLQHQHGLTDAEDVVLGLYAIEFMLFGEDGQRPASDYLPVTELTLEQRQTGFKSPAETPNERRRLLLEQQTSLLVTDLALLQTQWQARDDGSMYADWQALPPSSRQMVTLKTFERTLTQLMLRTVNATPRQDHSSHKPASQEPTGEESAPEENALSLEAAAASLEAASPWLPEDQQQAIRSRIELARAELQQIPASGDKATEHWGATYRAFKQAMDSFQGTDDEASADSEAGE